MRTALPAPLVVACQCPRGQYRDPSMGHIHAQQGGSTKPRLSFLDQNNENGEASRFGVKNREKKEIQRSYSLGIATWRMLPLPSVIPDEWTTSRTYATRPIRRRECESHSSFDLSTSSACWMAGTVLVPFWSKAIRKNPAGRDARLTIRCSPPAPRTAG